MQLEDEQIDFIKELAEAAQQLPRDERTFMYIPSMQAALLEGPVDRELTEAEEHDLQDFRAMGLIRVRHQGSHNSFEFTVAPEAYSFLANLAGRQPLTQVEDDIFSRYIDAEAFKKRYPDAHKLWAEAAGLLWGGNADAELTTIGHKTREAVQAFATALIDREGLADADPNPAHTVARLRAVVKLFRERLGETRHELLDALVHYWGEVNDLLQRQEHGNQKHGDPLSWEDGRRAIFQSAVVMYEIDRALQ